ncbi:MAG: signal recognition particle-docking protein FtsY [Holosporales bacterium]|jgi:fused signal recognition particle receptor|nr:signal recognition particle-docking protein FtsY [Holosporales bacterium]
MWFFKKIRIKKNEDLGKLEDILIEADFGPGLAEKIIGILKKNRKMTIKEIISNMLSGGVSAIPESFNCPTAIMLVGVNGSGKTTTVAKLANMFMKKGLSVDIAACDTFRVAATEQLSIMAKKLGINNMFAVAQSRDPASVAYEALLTTRKDILLIDTAGRLQNNYNLMAELKKISTVAKKIRDTAPEYTYITIDATTGQNAIEQVTEFQKMCNISGIILNKIDGNAKGGAIVRIINDLKIPIVAVGTGESFNDIEPFSVSKFLDNVFD